MNCPNHEKIQKSGCNGCEHRKPRLNPDGTQKIRTKDGKTYFPVFYCTWYEKKDLFGGK